MTLRKVKFFNTKPVYENGRFKEYIKEDEVEGVFHQFGLDVQEGDLEVASYSTAIIELENGEIVNHPVERVQFLDKPND